MVDEGRTSGIYETSTSKPWEDRGGMAVGTIVATAIAAGVIAYMLRRRREEELQPATRVARLARDFAGSDGMEAGRDFFVDKILPEMKPALLAILGEVEDTVDQAFRRAEKSVKKL